MKNREVNLGYLLNKATHLIKWELNNHLKEYNLTSAQWAVMSDLYFLEGINDATPAAIASRLKVERSAITRIINRLQKEGWISKTGNPLDHRSQYILLTNQAMEIIPEVVEVSDEVISATFHDFDEGDKLELKQYLIRIINNLK